MVQCWQELTTTVKLSITHGTMLARVNNYSEIIYNSWYNVGKSLTTTLEHISDFVSDNAYK